MFHLNARSGAGFSAVVLALALGSAGMANAQPARKGQGKPPEPPAQAYELCVDKSEGEAVTMTMPDGRTLEATCEYHDDKLAARPKRGPRGHEKPAQ